MLIGRSVESARLDEALAEGRGGRSATLVLRGAAGAGKTALLDDLVRRAVDFQVVRAVGVEWEMELPFAGLHQLCGPLLAQLDRLPAHQHDALRIAFGLSAGGPPDRFLIGVAVLGLICEAAEERPLLCLIDDVQWLDRSSVQVFSFVARRLQAEPVVLVFAIRDPFDHDELARLPELRVDGLCHADATALLRTTAGGLLDDQVRARILAEARGNPLALLELPRTVSPAALAGGFGLPGNAPVHRCIEASFLRRALDLPEPTRQLLLLSAADPTGDPGLLWATAAQLDLSMDALAPARAEALLEIGARVTFCHSLMRSAIYCAASDEDRRTAHRALAAATDPETDPERRAWHLAQAAVGPDPELADELARLADRAQARGGVAAAAAFLKRSASLTLDPPTQARRSLQAAAAMQLAGAPEEALALLSVAEDWRADAFDRAMAQRLKGQIALDHRRGDAVPLLLEAARRLGTLDPDIARETYAEALRAANIAGRLGPGPVDVATAARAAPSRSGPARAIDLLLGGLAIRFTDGYAASAAALKDALTAVLAEDGRPGQNMRWPWIARSVAPELFADETWHALTVRNLEISRAAGALGVLPLALSARAMTCCVAGDLDGAALLIAEADAIADATNTPPLEFARVMLAAYRGGEPALETIAASEAAATARGEGAVLTFGEYARAMVFNALGQHRAALDMAQRVAVRDELMLTVWSLPELVEAAVRCGDRGLAGLAMEDLTERTDAAGSEVALGIAARSRALLASGTAAEELYREALKRLAASRFTFDLARAHLLYGEWLRREQRRVDARNELRACHEMYLSMGAEAFAERACRELLATGETVGTRAVQAGVGLTAQETQIALLARDGLSNPEIATRLFISPRTVQYHLRKVFTKLEITSRNQLHLVLPAIAEAA